MAVTALGMIETIGLVSAIEAADAGLKAADVRLLGTDYVRGGLVMVRFEGEVAAVQAAVDAGAASAKRVGRVFSAHVIPRAMPEVFCMLASDVNEGPAKLHSGGCAQCGGCEGGRRELEALKKQEAQQSANRAEAKRSTDVKREEARSTISTGARSTDEAAPQNVGPSSAEAVTLAQNSAYIASLKVVQLRQLVRRLPDFPMTANDIRYSSKQQLLAALDRWNATSHS